jgi:hypothetical protein
MLSFLEMPVPMVVLLIVAVILEWRHHYYVKVIESLEQRTRHIGAPD